MPLSSPGAPTFAQVLPGAPSTSLQSLRSFVYRHKRYCAYITGSNLNILSSPHTLVQVIPFKSPLVSILSESQDGTLVVASKSDVCVLKPEIEEWTKVWWERSLLLSREDAADEVRWLSWGNEGEILVGGSHALSFFSSLPSSRSSSPADVSYHGEYIERRSPLWSIQISSSILFAEFSPSATLIATCGQHDRLVKVWRRLSFEEGLFDYSYLSHPGVVTHIQWRQLGQTSEERRGSGMSWQHDENPEILYTIATDGNLRVWKTGGHHDPDILVLHTTIDLVAAIPLSPTLTVKGGQPSTSPRYIFTIPSESLCAAINAAVGLPQDEKVNYALEHLKEIASKEPDIIVTLDGRGRMSAWGLQSIGHKRRPQTPNAAQPYHIAHAEGLLLCLDPGTPAVFEHWFQDDKFHLLAYAVGTSNDVTWWNGDVETLLSPAASGPDRLVLQSRWTGHDEKISNMESCSQGVVSWSGQKVIQWDLTSEITLEKQCFFDSGSNIMAASILTAAKALLTISASSFCLWDQNGRNIATASCQKLSKGHIHIMSSDGASTRGVFVQADGARLYGWVALISSRNGVLRGDIQLSDMSPLNHDDVRYAVAVASPFADSQTCIVSVLHDGQIECTTASVPGEAKALASFESGVREPCCFTANEKFAALVAKGCRELSIVDLIDGFVEYRQVATEPISTVVLSRQSSRCNLLAVGLSSTVEILAQARYSELSVDLPGWITAKVISIADIGLQCHSLAWAPEGHAAVACGNALLIIGNGVERKDLPQQVQETIAVDSSSSASLSLRALAEHLGSIAPVWHPSLLAYLTRHGQINVVAMILRQFAKKLKFWTRGESLDLDLDEILHTWQHSGSRAQFQLSDDAINDLQELFTSDGAPNLSRNELHHLGSIVDTVSYLREYASGLDANALAYLFSWKIQLLSMVHEATDRKASGQPNGVPAKQSVIPGMDWSMCALAHHSATQQPLLDILTQHYDNKLTWPVARKLGLLAWLCDREALEQVFEQLAQSAYRAEQPADPVNASLYFLALRKKPTLIGLWRIATWHKEQRSTMNFLKRDFNQPDAKTAARKNAYALMGKRRFEYSAAFFLLADDPQSAANTLASQCGDIQLAIAVVRLYCGDGSAVLRQLIDERIMPQAKKDANRWLMSWCHSVLAEKEEAAASLIRPLSGVKYWHQDDPLTLKLYADLRIRRSEHEYNAVLRSARILRGMGLWLPALQLVSRWKFEATPLAASTKVENATEAITNGMHDVSIAPGLEQAKQSQVIAPPSMLDDFSQPEPSTRVLDEKATREAKAAELLAKLKAKKEAPKLNVGDKKKPEPTQFKEPDANSLLDSFGL